MKKGLLSLVVIATITTAVLLSGCSANKLAAQLQKECSFENEYEDAILQTKIASLFTQHFSEVGSIKKKAMLVTIDCMRAEGLKYIMNSDLGMSAIAKDGGLYWTKPANLDTKAKIGLGVNFLGIVTGEEPSTFDVLKSTDPKRETPYSLMGKLSERYSVKFLTDNVNYIDTQLKSEFAAKVSQNLSWKDCKDSTVMREECLSSLKGADFISVASSELYFLAKGNYSLKNKDYFAAMMDLSYNVGNVYAAVKERTNEDWLFVVATTCGGQSNLSVTNEADNVLTFMLSNKKLTA